MEDWIRTTFLVITDGWTKADGTMEPAFIFSSGNGGQVTASLSVFLGLFGDVAVPPTATALRAVDPTDATGWHRHFTAWAEAGIIQAE